MFGIRACLPGEPDSLKSKIDKRLEYLDLEIKNRSRNIITLDNHKHICYFQNTYKHILHSKEDKNYNSLIDLVISLGESLEKHKENNSRIIENLLESIKNKNKVIKTLVENQDYLKEQNNKIIKRIKYLEELKQLKIEHKINTEKITKEVLEEIRQKSIELKQSYNQVEVLLHKIEKIILS